MSASGLVSIMLKIMPAYLMQAYKVKLVIILANCFA